MPQDPRFPVWQRAFAPSSKIVESFSGTVYRACVVRYANRDDLLTGHGSKQNGGRWNAQNAFRAVYLSTTMETAIAEFIGQRTSFGLVTPEKFPFVVVAVRAVLTNVVNLTDPTVRRALDVTVADLTADGWRRSQQGQSETLSQCLGRAAYRAKRDGLLVPSAVRRGGRNLVVFPGNLNAPESHLSILNRDELPDGA